MSWGTKNQKFGGESHAKNGGSYYRIFLAKELVHPSKIINVSTKI